MDELRAAALAYGAAQEKYRAEWCRRPPKSIPHPDGTTEVLFDDAQKIAVRAVHAARDRWEKLAEAMYAASCKAREKADFAAEVESVLSYADAKSVPGYKVRP